MCKTENIKRDKVWNKEWERQSVKERDKVWYKEWERHSMIWIMREELCYKEWERKDDRKNERERE